MRAKIHRFHVHVFAESRIPENVECALFVTFCIVTKGVTKTKTAEGVFLLIVDSKQIRVRTTAKYCINNINILIIFYSSDNSVSVPDGRVLRSLTQVEDADRQLN